MRASPESPRMFDQDWLDALSRTPWWTVPLVWGPITAALAALGARGTGPLAALGLFAAGWLVWSLTEYALHRTLFHWVPQTPWGPRMHFILHGVHHTWVFDRYRLVMPPAASLAVGLVFGSVFYTLLGPTWAPGAFAGFTFGYMLYDVTHYATHHLKLRWGWFQALKQHHMLHHHSPRHQDRKFGVSTRLWDRVFGTM